MHDSLIKLINLEGRHALVTGAGSGIGQAAALTLARAGASVLALDINTDGLSATQELARNEVGAEVTTAALDVCDRSAVDQVLATSTFNIVVNAAGKMAAESLSATSFDDWDRLVDVNLTGYFNVLKTAAPRMTAPGSVIQISSMMGHVGAGFPAYTAAKGAVLALTRQLAGELGPLGIRVNSVSPGMILTGMTRDFLSEDAFRNQIIARTPLRMVGAPDHIANAILFLASDLSAFMTGADMLVDGGATSAMIL
ncbi:SDR family NAD(P)-dependent oxidoreductase [Mycobacterium deserti]|uniref:SDR family oxidoreductase n=1 Tax=Mycobacterium deserti TaxID=2978347 RepID=A0ABT2MAH9_9MYCO|nr:SDR family oxidoreductase [Mycobacterium deserti]MCT7658006.1 SDR family oxidoreductase [Mycobacterium deserti]